MEQYQLSIKMRIVQRLRTFLTKTPNGQALVELLLVIGVSAIFFPALLTALVASREGRPQQDQRVEAVALMRETEEAVRSVREKGWAQFAVNGTFHPVISGNAWSFATGSATVNGMTQQLVITSVQRNSSGVVVESGGTEDTSTKKVAITVSWTLPRVASVSSTIYVTNFLENAANIKTTQTEFNTGTKQNVQTTNTSGGEITLGLNKAKWCSPDFANSNIDLPDGPPVAVAATSSASVSTPNDVFVAVAPTASSSVKLAYVNVTANTDPPASTLRGIFTMDSSKYSSSGLVPSGTGLDNSFQTNDVKYYKSASGKLYALLATTKPDKEVIAIQINDGSGDAYQDPTNKIYKYWTFFNTRKYQGNSQSTPNQDQAPWGYGATTINVMGSRGYAASGGYLYVFDLSNIDSKSPSNGLDMVGCRIELDGFDCRPNPAADKKYSSGETGTTYSTNGSPAHNDCSDGGNIELYATNDIYPVQSGSSSYVFAAVGAGTNPEFAIINVSTVPTAGTNPTISNNSCGRLSGGSSSWKQISTYDFNTNSGTEEASNSVYARSDGNRAYISSNGTTDSKQFYILNTTNKSAPTFLSGNPGSGPSSGYYQGSTPQGELYPRRSLTVLNGQRVVLVGKDGVANANDANEYQVLNLDTEATPTYCGGINFDSGFNDLTSVTEADFDNFVYMVANTQEKQLKIIQGGPDAIYVDAGVYTPAIYDFGSAVTLNRITMNVSTPSGTLIQTQVAASDPVAGSCAGAVFSYVGPDGTSGTYYGSTGGPIPLSSSGAFKNPARCFSYKSYLSTTDFNQTPVINDVTINYSP